MLVTVFAVFHSSLEVIRLLAFQTGCFLCFDIGIQSLDIKYCCNTVHAVNFHRELVLESATSGSLKVLEFHYQSLNSLN